jgi:hypothetical protein
MRHILFTMIMALAGYTAYGQADDCKCSDDLQGAGLENKLTCLVFPSAEIKPPDDEIYGQWRYGNIILNNGEVIYGKLMHYDGLNDQLIIDSKNPAIKLTVEKYTIQGFNMEILNSDRIIRFRRIRVKGKHLTDYQDVFLQVLLSGKNTLYVYRKLTKTLQVNGIVRNYVYFLKREDGSMASFVKPSRKSLLDLFPEKRDLFRMHLRKIHNHVRNEEQLILALDMINSL